MALSLKERFLEFFKDSKNYKDVLDACTLIEYDIQSAEDATQQAFLRLIEKTGDGKSIMTVPEDALGLKFYIMQTARNCYYEIVRRKMKFPSSSIENATNLVAEVQPVKNYNAIQKLNRLNQLILERKELFTGAQLQLWQCLYEFRSVEVIMEKLGKKKQTIYSLTNKLKEKIKTTVSFDMLLS